MDEIVTQTEVQPTSDELLQLLIDEQKLTNEKLDTLIQVNSSTPELDYTESFNQLIDRFDSLTAGIDSILGASNTIVTYGVFYVPLIIIVLMLWWFFKQFIR